MKHVLCIGVVALLFGCAGQSTSQKPLDSENRVTWAIALHGGAGAIRKDVDDQTRKDYLTSLEAALDIGRKILEGGGTSMDACEAVVRALEDDEKFNAGKGAVLTHDKTIQVEASIMDGSNLACGAVTGLTTVKNPITLARKVMENTQHIFLMADGAERFATEMDVERVPNEYFFTPKRIEQLEKAIEKDTLSIDDVEAFGESATGTVGCVALDAHGNLAAATSTGGRNNKMHDRIGDTPIIGAGNYANNKTCAVSGTGWGEAFLRHCAAVRVSDIMEYGGASLADAADRVVFEILEPGQGGIIAVDKDGSITMAFNTTGMFRAAADSTGKKIVAIWE